MSSLRPSPWHRNPDDSGQRHVPPAGATDAAPPPEGIEAMHAHLDRLRPILRRMRRHWMMGLVGFLVVGLLTAGVAFRFRPAYLSETVVFHQEGMNPESLGGGGQKIDADFMRELLLRRGRLEKLIDELKLHQKTVQRLGMGVAVDEMQQLVRFKAISNSTFKISYTGESAEEAQAVTKWLADQLVDEDLERRQAQAKQAKEFLDTELARAEVDLAAHEEALGQFISKNPEFGSAKMLLPSDGKAAAPRPAPAPAPVAAGPRPRAPKKGEPTPAPAPRPVPKMAEPDPALVSARQDALQDLARASRELAQLQTSYTEQHPEVSAAQNRVRDAEARVKAAGDAIAKASADDIYSSIEDAPPPLPAPADGPAPAPAPVAKGGKARPAPAAAPEPPPPVLKSADEILGAAETDFMRLKRAVEEARARAERLAAESFRAEVASRSQGTGHEARVVVLDAAYLPAAPIRGRLFFVKIGLPVALLLAMLLVVGRAILDDRIYDATDLRHLGFDPLLTVVPGKSRTHV